MKTVEEKMMTDLSKTQKTSVGSFLIKKKKLILFLALGTILVGVFINYGDHLDLKKLATKEAALRDYQSQHLVVSLAIAFTVYAIVTGASFPGAAVLTLLCGWLFGFATAVILVSFASTTGATLSFLMSRFFFRDFVESKFGKYLEKFNQALEKEGVFYLFMLRLIPAVPFFVINLVMGLTSIKTRSFWWVSQLGMLPGTAVYVYAGSEVPKLSVLAEKGVGGIMTPQLWLAFSILAIFPYAVRRVVSLFSKEQTKQELNV